MKPAVAPPPGNPEEPELYARKRWKHVQVLADMFWTRWRKEYLVNLQERQKWHTPRQNLQIDDVVLVTDANLPRNKWRLGRVIEIHQDKNETVRIATLQTQDNKLCRPVHKLIKLLSKKE